MYAAITETEHVSRTAALAPGGTLRVKNFSGRVTITGTDRQDASIEAERRAARDVLDHMRLEIRMEGSTLVVSANEKDSGWKWSRHNRVVDTDLDIKVPRHTNLDADVFSAPLSVQGLEGSHRIHAFSSRVRLEDMVGPIKAHSFSGAVEIHERAWQDGQVVDVDTFSGNITLRVPDTANGSLSFNSFSGHLHSDFPLILREGSRRSVRAELGAPKALTAEADPTAKAGGTPARGSLRFKTFSGSVRLDR